MSPDTMGTGDTESREGHFVHALGECESDHIGVGTKVWAFAHILPGAVIGRDCNICDHVFIENDVIVGDRVTLKSGVQLWDGVRLEDDVFVGPNATFTNDRFPRSKVRRREEQPTTVQAGASLGANCTILPGIVIGAGAMVAAGAVVTRDVPPHTVVAGNPAQILRHLESDDEATIGARHLRSVQPSQSPGVAAVSVTVLRQAVDMRGKLAAADFEDDLPFMPRRVFVVYGVPTSEVRGEHAHRECEQLLICVAGSLSVTVDDGCNRQDFDLTNPRIALHVPARVWAVQHHFTADAVLLVLASQPYSPDDYIRSYEEFLEVVSPSS